MYVMCKELNHVQTDTDNILQPHVNDICFIHV